MENPNYMICNICNKKVKVRKVGGYGRPFPVEHDGVNGRDNCHGFFIEGSFVKREL